MLHAALDQLPRLKVLLLGDFLTREVVSLFADLQLPQLHTFGFRVHCRDTQTFGHQVDYMHIEMPGSLELVQQDLLDRTNVT